MQQSSNIDLSIIIPTYNESQRIGKTLDSLSHYLKKYHKSIEVIIVDADSPDKTITVAKKYSKQFKHFKVINAGPKPPRKAVKGEQVKQAMLIAKGDYVMFMDADLATPLKYLDEVFSLISQQKKIGICVRNLQSSHKGLRKFISSAGNSFVQLLILPGISDTQCGFKVFESSAAKQIFSRQTIKGWGFDMEILAIARQLGYQIDTFSVPDWHDVQAGSKISGSKFSALKAAFQTLPDVFKIKYGLISGRYKKNQPV